MIIRYDDHPDRSAFEDKFRVAEFKQLVESSDIIQVYDSGSKLRTFRRDRIISIIE